MHLMGVSFYLAASIERGVLNFDGCESGTTPVTFSSPRNLYDNWNSIYCSTVTGETSCAYKSCSPFSIIAWYTIIVCYHND